LAHYFGETEKNMAGLFDKSERLGMVLLSSMRLMRFRSANRGPQRTRPVVQTRRWKPLLTLIERRPVSVILAMNRPWRSAGGGASGFAELHHACVSSSA
jgi:hypothetical protein